VASETRDPRRIATVEVSGTEKEEGMNTAVMFGKATDEWETPREVFDALDEEFGFVTDVAASKENAKCSRWFGPGRGFPFDDALQVSWSHGSGRPVWMNPPYSRVREFMSKASWEARHNGPIVVALVPARTDTRWWHEHVYDAAKNRWRPGVEVRFIKGRLKFGNSNNSAPFPSVVIVFRPPTR
jgi:site-specific DNA-methyltransferase (adenine-specific)